MTLFQRADSLHIIVLFSLQPAHAENPLTSCLFSFHKRLLDIIMKSNEFPIMWKWKMYASCLMFKTIMPTLFSKLKWSWYIFSVIKPVRIAPYMLHNCILCRRLGGLWPPQKYDAVHITPNDMSPLQLSLISSWMIYRFALFPFVSKILTCLIVW